MHIRKILYRMKPFQKLLLATTLVVSLTNCASMMENYRAQTCNENAGYERGMNDAREDKPMNSQFAQPCGAEIQAVVMRGYRGGYSAGMSSKNPPAPANSLININIGGASSDPSNQANPRAYFCSFEVFMTKFEEFGPTDLETRQSVVNKCTAQYASMHCNADKVLCRKNQ